MIKPANGHHRVLIEAVTPQLEAGRYAIHRIVGDEVKVSAAIFADGHDFVQARVLYRHRSQRSWGSALMHAGDNDTWTGQFIVDKLGFWEFTILGWIDHFRSWSSDLRKRLAAQPSIATETTLSNEISLALRRGTGLVKEASFRAHRGDAKLLRLLSQELSEMADKGTALSEFPLSDELEQLVSKYPDLSNATQFERYLPLRVDRERARFSAWYELFPRSASPIAGRHGTFADVERQLPEIAAMGFDIVYLPPIHPIGHSFRRGVNNSETTGPDDVGSPWAIGERLPGSVALVSGAKKQKNNEGEGDNGGHKSIHPQLGSFADFDRLIAAAKTNGMEIALDIAFQCSPDHPWVIEHPDWFLKQPDGSIQYAENPPKKYQDIYPLNFESPDWRRLWDKLYSVMEFWITHGVEVFRVDNPHTKALPFWEWCLAKILKKYPGTIFLAEAFTRPQIMYSLARIGFTQSYTYFTWRNTKIELQSYLEEITRPPVSDFFMPNLWPNTPDILHKFLQEGGRPAFRLRAILASTLASSYGIYGPAYELCEKEAAEPLPGSTESEEYQHSEKYEIRHWNRGDDDSLAGLFTLLNEIRRANPALQSNDSLRFHAIDNPNLLCYSKTTPHLDNVILVVINLDPFHEQMGWTDLDLDQLGVARGQEFVVEDLLTGSHYTWRDGRNYIALKPDVHPAHILSIPLTR